MSEVWSTAVVIYIFAQVEQTDVVGYRIATKWIVTLSVAKSLYYSGSGNSSNARPSKDLVFR